MEKSETIKDRKRKIIEFLWKFAKEEHIVAIEKILNIK